MTLHLDSNFSRRQLFHTMFAAAAVGNGLLKAQSPAVLLEPVGKNLSMLSGVGGNVAFLVAPHGLLMVDSGLPNSTAALMQQAKAAAPKIAILINTHWHQDHTGGNTQINKSGAQLIAHINVKKRLSTHQSIAALKREFDPLPPEGQPTETFTDKGHLSFAGEQVHYQRLQPAHTDGDTVVHFHNANVLHCGDLYFNGTYPFIDYSSGGSIEGMIVNAARIGKLCDGNTKLIPGHGAISNKAGIKQFHSMLAGVNAAVSKQINEGMALPEIIAAKPLAKWDAKWGQGFMKSEQFIGLLYQGKRG